MLFHGLVHQSGNSAKRDAVIQKSLDCNLICSIENGWHSATRLTGSKGQFQAGEPVEVWFLKREGLHGEKVQARQVQLQTFRIG